MTQFKMLKVLTLRNFLFKHHPNQLYMLGYGYAAAYHRRIRMGIMCTKWTKNKIQIY